ncbi:MAG: hypothetical protein Q8P20_09145 [bacterium]|nr:hypothetical protein [bacterium]
MKKNITKKIILMSVILAVAIIISPLTNNASAQEKTTSGYQYYVGGWEIIPKECIDPNTTDSKGILIRCDANSFVQMFVNFSTIMLKLSPPIIILVFMYGGFKFMSAKGKQETIQTGKKILGSAALGMAIITFLGWTLTFFIVQALTGVDTGKLFNNSVNVTSRDWWNPSAVTDDSNDNNLGLQCCVVPYIPTLPGPQLPQYNSGCDMKTKTECTTLGGNSIDGTCDDVAKAQCDTINARVNCCISPDANGNGNPDECRETGANNISCINSPTGFEAIPQTCAHKVCN